MVTPFLRVAHRHSPPLCYTSSLKPLALTHFQHTTLNPRALPDASAPFNARPKRPSLFASSRFLEPLFVNPAPRLLQRSATSRTRNYEGEGGSPPASHHAMPLVFYMVLEIISIIWRLPSTILEFLRKEEKFIDEVEEDIDKGADVVQVAAKAVEEVAEGLEKAAKVIENDAEKVDTLMDKVKATNKSVHDEIEGVGMLEGSMQEVEKTREGKVEVKEATMKEVVVTEKKTTIDAVTTSSNQRSIHQHELLKTRTKGIEAQRIWTGLPTPRVLSVHRHELLIMGTKGIKAQRIWRWLPTPRVLILGMMMMMVIGVISLVLQPHIHLLTPIQLLEA